MITDLESALRAIIKHFGDKVIEVKRIDKSAIIHTKDNVYYFKYDKDHWHNAGFETGKFKGAGLAINAGVFETLDSYRADILYCNPPGTVYHFNIENFRKNSHKHIQKYNGEEVYVISLYQANGVFYI